MTIQEFITALRTGSDECGNVYPNAKGVSGWHGGVRLNNGYFQYTVSNRTTPVTPCDVADVVESLSARIQPQTCRGIFHAKIRKGKNWYMLWHSNHVAQQPHAMNLGVDSEG
jgi:hypothetical protein